MKFWPVPDSYDDSLPDEGSAGSFWEDRHGVYNCGVDIFCDEGSEIVSIEKGRVLDIGEFTNKNNDQYYNDSYYLIIKNASILYKYANLKNTDVKIGQNIEAGTVLGQSQQLIKKDNIDDAAPFYLREMVYKGYTSMLHLELYKSPIMEVRPYKYGNFLGNMKPTSVLNPTLFLSGLKKGNRI